jgi:hypothetical protein
MHWLYYLYNALSFAGGLLLHLRDRLSPQPRRLPQPLTDLVEADRS